MMQPEANPERSRTAADMGQAAGGHRLLLSAYECHPLRSMESRVGWQRVLFAARHYPTWVLTGEATSELEGHLEQVPVAERPRVVTVESGQVGRWMACHAETFYLAYRSWQRRAFHIARQLHAQHPFSLAHQVNYCGFREPGFLHELGIPFVWGPWGGTCNYPVRMLSLADGLGGVREIIRGVVNLLQLRYSRRVRRAVTNSAEIFVANSEAGRDLERCYGRQAELLLETGLSEVCRERRTAPDLAERPLRILWSGRLRTWKALPLLLRGLAELRREVPFQLRVMGVGDRLGAWQREVRYLRLEDVVYWVGWPSYDQQLEQYRWADVFAFTSLRDTSGTGLLEALAYGVPLVGVNHQGCQDIMTPGCGIGVPVTSARAAITGFREAIRRLAQEPELWARLSAGASERAEDFLWERLNQRILAAYQRQLGRELVHREQSGNDDFDSATAVGATPTTDF